LNLAEFVKFTFRQVLIRGTIPAFILVSSGMFQKTWLHKIADLICLQRQLNIVLHPQVAKTNQ
jgi:predicted membrane protein